MKKIFLWHAKLSSELLNSNTFSDTENFQSGFSHLQGEQDWVAFMSQSY